MPTSLKSLIALNLFFVAIQVLTAVALFTL